MFYHKKWIVLLAPLPGGRANIQKLGLMMAGLKG